MNAPAMPSMSHGSVRPMSLGAIMKGIPKPKKIAPPKLQRIRIEPATNGARVFHDFDTAHSKQFVFENPKLMVSHIKRAVNNAWLKPGDNAESARIERAADL